MKFSNIFNIKNVIILATMIFSNSTFASTVITSNWNTPGDRDGWGRNYPTVLAGVGRGDESSDAYWSDANGGTFMMYDIATGNPDWFLAPAKFLGDWSSGGHLTFSYYTHHSVTTDRFIDITDGSSFWFAPTISLVAGWNYIDVNLSSFGADLRNIRQLGISGDLIGDVETNYLENFTLTLNGSSNPSKSVPEPASWILTVVGVCGVLALRYRPKIQSRNV